MRWATLCSICSFPQFPYGRTQGVSVWVVIPCVSLFCTYQPGIPDESQGLPLISLYGHLAPQVKTACNSQSIVLSQMAWFILASLVHGVSETVVRKRGGTD
jgi:hypothetical protein